MNVNLQIHPIQQWAVLASCPEHLEREYTTSKIDSVLQYYIDQRKKFDSEFNQNVSSAKTGEELVEDLKTVSSSMEHAHKSKLRELKKISGVSSITPCMGRNTSGIFSTGSSVPRST